MPAAKKSTRKHSLIFDIAARIVISLLAVGFFLLLRPDYAGAAQSKYRRYVSTPGLISAYMREHPVRKLQIGSGDNDFESWLNTEYDPHEGQAFLDATNRFPLPDNSFNYVFSEHVIEHFQYWDGLKMLQESYRVLKPGGRIRVVTPNLDKLMALSHEPTEEMQRYIREKLAWHGWWPHTPDPAALIVDMESHDFGHQFLYNPSLLRDSLQKVGFRNVTICQVGVSADPQLANLEVRPGFPGEWPKRYESMAIEAEK